MPVDSPFKQKDPPSPSAPQGRPAFDPRVTGVLGGVLGGLVVLVIGAILIATDVIDTGERTRPVVSRQAPISKPGSIQPNDKGGDLTVNRIYEKDGPGVVFISAQVSRGSTSPFGAPEQGDATGSGFVLDKDGYVLTNAHVVEGAGNGDVEVRFGEGDAYEASVVGRDPSSDLALLKVDAPKDKLQPLALGDSKNVDVGDPTVAIGNPFGLDRTVTTGIVSALQRQIEAPNGFSINNVIQTDASINPGNSGGPLIDADGKVIGINSQIATGGSQGSVGIGFAVPINTAKRAIPEMKKGGEVARAYIGVTTAPVNRQAAQDLNLPVDRGALVQDVSPGSPADKAGLEAGRTETTQGITAGGDLIVKVAGKNVTEPDDVAAAIEDKSPGDRVPIEFYRGETKRTATLTLAKRPANAQPGSQQEQQPSPEELLPLP